MNFVCPNVHIYQNFIHKFPPFSALVCVLFRPTVTVQNLINCARSCSLTTTTRNSSTTVFQIIKLRRLLLYQNWNRTTFAHVNEYLYAETTRHAEMIVPLGSRMRYLSV